MDIKEIIYEGLTYTVMGICVVFLVLVIIMLVIKAMELIAVEKKHEEKVAEKVVLPVVEQAPKAADDTELIAVITAAVAAAMGTKANGLVIRSYKKISGGAWNNAGRREVLDNRF